MIKNNSQVINSTLIVLGGALLIYEIATEKENVYILIVGLVSLMLGLYRATNHWVVTKDDHKEEMNEDSNEKNI